MGPPSSSESKKTEEYSKEFLAHLKELNVQVSSWINTHIEKNAYVFLSPVFKDYEKHLKGIEEKFKNTSTPKSETTTESTSKEKDIPAASKPLLGAVFGSNSDDSKPKESAEPVKFGTSTGFAFGSAVSESAKSEEKSTGFSFGSSSETSKSTGFSFGASKTDTETKPVEKSDEKPEEKSNSGFSFGSNKPDTEEKKPPLDSSDRQIQRKARPKKQVFRGLSESLLQLGLFLDQNPKIPQIHPQLQVSVLETLIVNPAQEMDFQDLLGLQDLAQHHLQVSVLLLLLQLPVKRKKKRLLVRRTMSLQK